MCIHIDGPLADLFTSEKFNRLFYSVSVLFNINILYSSTYSGVCLVGTSCPFASNFSNYPFVLYVALLTDIFLNIIIVYI